MVPYMVSRMLFTPADPILITDSRDESIRNAAMVHPVLSHPTRGNLQSLAIGALDLERGGRLDSVTVAYRTWGRLNTAGDNAVLVLHALTGDSRAAGEDGWWEPLIGPRCALDTDKW